MRSSRAAGDRHRRQPTTGTIEPYGIDGRVVFAVGVHIQVGADVVGSIAESNIHLDQDVIGIFHQIAPEQRTVVGFGNVERIETRGVEHTDIIRVVVYRGLVVGAIVHHNTADGGEIEELEVDVSDVVTSADDDAVGIEIERFQIYTEGADGVSQFRVEDTVAVGLFDCYRPEGPVDEVLHVIVPVRDDLGRSVYRRVAVVVQHENR